MFTLGLGYHRVEQQACGVKVKVDAHPVAFFSRESLGVIAHRRGLDRVPSYGCGDGVASVVVGKSATVGASQHDCGKRYRLACERVAYDTCHSDRLGHGRCIEQCQKK